MYSDHSTKLSNIGIAHQKHPSIIDLSTVIMVGLSLEFMYNMGSRFHLLNNKELHPAAIVGAFVV